MPEINREGESSSTRSLLDRLPWTVSESGWSYDGPFSTYKELHSAILGLAAGYLAMPALAAAVVAYATGRGSKGSRTDAHWRQVTEEPAYALGAMTIGRSLQGSAAVGTIVDAATSLL